MSYQVLARKWRPSSFEQVVGQQHVLQALVNALDQQRLHHAYLFTGTRGVGKTTIARLLAKALNCEVSVSSNPCGKCSSCIEIDNGSFIDLIEVDAASKTKVEDTRDILDNVQYKPTRGRYKVYLIDEVHMLSRSSFNALLKTLEEPPEHVKFLFATTEASKLPITILSRCLQFNLKAITVSDIAAQLARVLTAEQVEFDQQSLALIAEAAKGSMRDALSLTDQAIAFGNGQLQYNNVAQMLGTLDNSYSVNLLSLAATGQGEQLLSKLTEIAEFSPDYDNLLKQMAKDVQLSSLTQISNTAADMAADPGPIRELAVTIDAELLQLFYHLLLQGRKELPFSPDPQSGFAMIMLRLLAFLPKDKPTQQPQHLEALESQQQNILEQAKTLQPNRVTSAVKKIAPPQHHALAKPSVVKPNAPQATASESKAPQLEEPELKVPESKAPESKVEQTETLKQSNNNASTDVVQSAAPVESFSEQEMMNMSFAMASEDEQEPVTTMQDVAAAPQPPATTISATGINDFLSARKTLRKKTIIAEATEVKKPLAVKTLKTEITTKSEILPQQEQPQQLEVAPTAPRSNMTDPATLLVANTTDPWSVLIDNLGIGGRLRLLAIKSSYRQDQDQIELILRTKHQHLLAGSAQEQLQQQLRNYLKRDIILTITVGVDDQKTPEEIADIIHLQRKDLAVQCIKTDKNIEQFEQLFGAQIIDETINYRSLKQIS